MFSKFNTHMRTTAIISLVLAFAMSLAWAVDKGGNDARKVTYRAREVIKKGNGTTIDVVNEGEKIIKVWVDSGALDAYMKEQGIKKVNLTVDITETLIEPRDGDSYYQLDFEFGPSGAFFSPDLEVRLEKAYYNSEVWMYDEDGELLETYEHGSDGKLYFLVPHFSRYSYDFYDY